MDLRRSMARTLLCAGRGHLPSAFSLVEILRVLYDDVLRVDPGRPDWPDRDRLILSKGHGCLALYVLLAEHGFFPADELSRFCRSDGILGGHPERGRVPGVEASTGALGHGMSIGLGFALAARMDRRPSRVFVILGDGECDEGSVWEAALAAAKHRLGRLCVIVDRNKQQSCGDTDEILDLEPFADKWRAFGFQVEDVDGHDVDALRDRLSRPTADPGRPRCLIAHTVKGRGADFMEGNLSWHHKSNLKPHELAALKNSLEMD